ncbi:MAG: efflux RND transporter periplasmic adaptor subunit [Archangiaceae bacterium]|nr:efflux RND transporter periplasmic adaptor subunit [Archangiaceae bacterium]
MTDEVTATAAPERPAAPAKAKRSRARWVLLGLGLAIGLGVFLFVRRGNTEKADEKQAKAAANRKVPVTVARVVQRDVPIVLEGLGSVTPLASVTVKTQVDGRLESVAFAEGQAVKKGDLLAQIDPRPFRIALQQAQAAQQRDAAQLRNAELNLARYQDLRKQNLVAQQQVDDQATLAAQARGAVALDAAQVANAQLQLEWSRIVAPVDGVVGIRQIDPGNLVHASDATGLVLVTQLDPIAVTFTLPQDELPRVARARELGPLAVEVFDRDGKNRLAVGKLTVIDNQVSATTATIKLKAQFDNAAHVLWPSQFVKARLLVETKQGAVTVPAVAVQRGQKGSFVYVVTPQSKAELRPVEVDSIEGAVALISKGLQPDEQVVTDGQSQLKPGAQVDAREEGQKRGGGEGRDGGPAPSGERPDGPANPARAKGLAPEAAADGPKASPSR